MTGRAISKLDLGGLAYNPDRGRRASLALTHEAACGSPAACLVRTVGGLISTLKNHELIATRCTGDE